MQRTKNIQSYEKTIKEAEQRYGELVISSGFLVKTLKDNAEFLDENMGNKKVGPDIKEAVTEEQEEIKKYIDEITQKAEILANFIYMTSTKI